MNVQQYLSKTSHSSFTDSDFTSLSSSYPIDDDDDQSTIIKNSRHLSLNFLETSKPKLTYKKPPEYTQYSNCLITYLDHPSAIFIQLLNDAPYFQQMHQNMNRYYADNLHTFRIDSFEIGDFCIAYSCQYSEYFRARILNIDRINDYYLIIYVDFGNSEWLHLKYLRRLHNEFTHLQIQSIPVTLSHILPRKDLSTKLIHWNTSIGKECTRKLRRLLIKPSNEPILFVCITFLSYEKWWSLPFVDIKLDGQDIAEILHKDGLARLTNNPENIKMIYPYFGRHYQEKLIFGI